MRGTYPKTLEHKFHIPQKALRVLFLLAPGSDWKTPCSSLLLLLPKGEFNLHFFFVVFFVTHSDAYTLVTPSP
jgi:hypothetical protein